GIHLAAVVARDLRAAAEDAGAIGTRIGVVGTRAGVGARLAPGDRDRRRAAARGVAAVRRAWIAVVADQWGLLALALDAGVGRTGVVVVAVRVPGATTGDVHVRAPDERIADVGGACVVVVAFTGRRGRTDTGRADVVAGVARCAGERRV